MILIVVVGLLLAACQTKNQPEVTPVPSDTPRSTNTPTVEPTLTLTPTAILPTAPPRLKEPLFDWPPPQLTEEQIAASQECLTSDLYGERYQNMDGQDPQSLFEAYEPQNGCDWVLYTLVAADYYSEEDFHAGDEWSILQNTIYNNPGLLFSSPWVFYGANYHLEIVAPPPFTEQPLKQVQINYQWSGMGAPVSFDLTIQIEDEAWVTGTANYGSDFVSEDQEEVNTFLELDQEVMFDIVEELGTSLENLIPVESQGEFFMCYDNYPDWEITLVYEDGTKLMLVTNGSNIYDMGAPFQTQIDGQNYILGSTTFYETLWLLVSDMGLSLGSPMAMACFDENYMDVVFPQN